MNYKKVLNNELSNLESLYLVHGSDDYQIGKFVEKFIEKHCTGDFKEFNLDVLAEDDNSMAQLFNSIETLPFMAEKRVVIFHAYELLAQKTSMDQRLLDLISDIPETTVLILVSHKKTDKRLKLYKEIKETGNILEFEELKYKKLDQWIKKQVQKEDYKITNRAVKLLEEAFNNNLQRLKSELEKIIIFADDTDMITKDIIEQVISKDWLVKDNIVFDFVDEIGRNNTSKALNLLFDILNEGTTPKQIIGMIARQIRLMLQSKILSKKGLTIEQIAGRLKQHPYPVKKCLKQSRNFSIESLEQALEKLSEADYNLVTGNNDHLELELLVVELKETI